MSPHLRHLLQVETLQELEPALDNNVPQPKTRSGRALRVRATKAR